MAPAPNRFISCAILVLFSLSAARTEDQAQVESIRGSTDWLAHIEAFAWAHPMLVIQIDALLVAMQANPRTAGIDQMVDGLNIYWEARTEELRQEAERQASQQAKDAAQKDYLARKAADEAAKKAQEEQEIKDQLRGGRHIDKPDKPDKPPPVEKPIEKRDIVPRVNGFPNRIG